MASLMPQGKQQYFDSNGNNLSGGKLYAYAAGTSTPLDTYSDQAGTIPNTNPVILNARGEATIFWGASAYKVVLKDASDVEIYTQDNLQALVGITDLASSASGKGASLVGLQDANGDYAATTVEAAFAEVAQTFKSSVGRVINSIAALRLLDKTKFTRAFVTGYYAAGDGGGGPYWYDSTDTTSADNGGTIIVATDGGRWKLQVIGHLSVKQFGAKGDGTTDDTSHIQAAIDSGKPYSSSSATGRGFYFPKSRYKVTTLDLTDCHGVYLFGDGPYATEIFTSGTNQVIKAIGSSGTPLNKAGVRSMTIRGGGAANANAHGVDIQWGNHCYLHDLVVFGCRNAMNLAHQWQTSLRDISVHGTGADQSYIGVFMDATDLTFIDNAVQAVNVFVQSTSGYGFRLINAQGSKFTNCEAGGSPMIYGWYIGDPPSGTVKCQWAHFVNCLGDSTSGPAWLFRQGAASELSVMQLANCWAGNGDQGFYFDGCTYIAGSNLLAAGNTNSGIRLVNSSYLTIDNCQLNGNNEAASAAVGDIHIQGGSYNSIRGNTCQSNAAGKSLLETGGTDNNTISSNTFFQGATIIGANTDVHRNRGFKTENRGSAQIVSGSTSVSVNHGLAITPTVDHIRITPRDNMGSASKFWVSAADATTFTLNVNINPGSTITFGWSIDLVKVS